MVKVMPSASAFSNWKAKSLVNFVMFTGVLNQALPA